MTVIQEVTRNGLILCFRLASVLFLIGCPIVMLLKRALWRPWLLESTSQGLLFTLAPLRSLSERVEMRVSEGDHEPHALNGDAPRLLLPPPAPPKLDLNQASVEDLRQLEGVGFVKALEIIEYRERFGDYRRLEELGMIPGIGAKTLQLIGDKFEVKRLS